MKKNRVLILSLCAAVLFSGCSLFNGKGSASLELPPNAEQIVSRYNIDQDETLFSYNGRTYSYFGGLNGKMSNDSVRECIGYTDNDKDTRVYTLYEDISDNYLMIRHTGGIMDQPEFLRAVDTKNRDIYTPSYIKSGCYETWGSSGIHYELPEVMVGLICNAKNITAISYEVVIDGESAFVGGVENANKSTIKTGELFNLGFNELMFQNKAVVGKPFCLTLNFTVTDNEGRDHEVKGTYSRDMMLGASLNDLEIREDGNGGYILFEDL